MSILKSVNDSSKKLNHWNAKIQIKHKMKLDQDDMVKKRYVYDNIKI